MKSEPRPTLGDVRVSVAVSATTLVLAAALTSGAGAARTPTPSERAALTLASFQVVPQGHGATAFFLIRRVLLSTVTPGRNSRYSSFAAAFGLQSGPPPGPRVALVGRSRLTRNWVGIAYGVPRVLCDLPQRYFGGRQAAILADLGIRCQ